MHAPRGACSALLWRSQRAKPTFTAQVLLFPAATNYTTETGETMEILAGNTKTLLSIAGW